MAITVDFQPDGDADFQSEVTGLNIRTGKSAERGTLEVDLDQLYKIEQKIKRLEDRLKILENQIQNTLLDVREQIAGKFYPSLRSDGEEGESR